MSKAEFMDSCPKELESYILSYKLKKEKENETLWLQGLYTNQAVLCAVENVMQGRNAKLKYMDKPIDFNKKPESAKEYTEEEIQRARDALVAKLQIMECNFKHNNK